MEAFSHILGHRRQLDSLRADMEQGNVAHAYLFSGSRHMGKFTIAKSFARELLCIGRSPEERKQVLDDADRLLHPDILSLDQLWIEDRCEDLSVIGRSTNILQQHRQKSHAKTDTISIDDIRALQDRLHGIGAGMFRCCLIRSIERMQAEAVNALLKVLEEPPAGMVFLLTTQALSSLLPTLVSRVRVMHFSRLTDADLQTIVAGASEEEKRFILRIAQGAPGIAAMLRADPDLLRRERQAYGNALSFWHSHSALQRLQLLEPVHARSPESDQFLTHLALALRDEEGPFSATDARHLIDFQRNLDTNVNRQLLAQNFVLALSSHGA